MNKYELMVLLKTDPKSDKSKKSLDLVREELKKLGAKIIKEDDWGVKELAYMMDKESQAHYVVFVYEIEPSKSLDLNIWINRSDFILRSMVTKLKSSPAN